MNLQTFWCSNDGEFANDAWHRPSQMSMRKSRSENVQWQLEVLRGSMTCRNAKQIREVLQKTLS